MSRGMPLKPVLSQASRLFRQKMEKIPEEAIYSPQIPAGFDLESRYDRLDAKRAEALLLADGSIQTSVSATAFFARATGDERALAYLRRVVELLEPQVIAARAAVRRLRGARYFSGSACFSAVRGARSTGAGCDCPGRHYRGSGPRLRRCRVDGDRDGDPPQHGYSRRRWHPTARA